MPTEKDILKGYARYIVHIRAQYQGQKLGLFFGAGISKYFNIPNWHQLIEKMALDEEVDGKNILDDFNNKSNSTALTQYLFQHFKQRHYGKTNNGGVISDELEPKISSRWKTIIHRNLYKDATDDDIILNEHPYLKSFVEIIKNTSLTVNYNFDDIIERLLFQASKENDDKERGFETVWHHSMQFRRTAGTIYHPNGFLPRNLLESTSERIIFSEYEFADQLIGSMAGHSATISNQLYKNTCLFIGLSLEDNTLKHLLRQNAIINPGHFHYYVYYLEKNDELSSEQKQTVFDSNYEVYNLITLFLTGEEIRSIANLIKMDHEELAELADELNVQLKYVFYLTGVIGIGKTTALSYLRSLLVLDEWPERAHPLLAKPYNILSDQERDDVDEWVARQFFNKNSNLTHKKEGIFVIDRAPIDPIAFTEEQRIPGKAKYLLSVFQQRSIKEVHEGVVILLTGDEKQIRTRVSYRGENIAVEYITNQQDTLKGIYQGDGCILIECRGLSVEKVVHLITKVIFNQKYIAKNIHSLLVQISESR